MWTEGNGGTGVGANGHFPVTGATARSWRERELPRRPERKAYRGKSSGPFHGTPSTVYCTTQHG